MKPLILEDKITGENHLIHKFKTYKIGRGIECDIVTLNPEIPDTKEKKYSERIRKMAGCVSGLHAEISYEKQGVFILDRGSTNGTYIQLKNSEEKKEIFIKTSLPYETTIYFSTKYPMILHAPVDIESQEKKEKRARTDDTCSEISLGELEIA